MLSRIAVCVLWVLATAWTASGQGLAELPDLVEKIAPSAVSISATTSGEGKATDRLPDLPPDSPLKELFENLPSNKQPPKGEAKAGEKGDTKKKGPSLGSGMITSADGYIATADYVVADADKITVTLDNGMQLPAQLVGSDKRTGIALLKVTPTGPLTPVSFADSDKVRRGVPVIAIGNPFGLGNSISLGVISATARNVGTGPFDFLQTDAAINRGHSGGPLFDLKGNVVGMSTAIFSPTGGNVGVAFAIPSNLVSEVASALEAKGVVERGWLGVKIQDVTQDTATSLKLPSASGALVAEIVAGTPAARAGLKASDVIVSLDEETIANSRGLAALVASRKPDEVVRLSIIRDGQTMAVPVTLGRFPAAGPPGADKSGDAASSDGKSAAAKPEKPESAASAESMVSALGLSLVAPSGGKKGALIDAVDPAGEAAKKGLKAGDVIEEIGGHPVANPADFNAQIAKAREAGHKSLLVSVRADGARKYVALSLPGG